MTNGPAEAGLFIYPEYLVVLRISPAKVGY